jgi:thiamine biosynthesis lipoprotein
MTWFSSSSLRRCRPLLGTFVEVSAWGDATCLDRAVDAAFSAIGRVQRLMSFHDPASELSRLNREASGAPVKVNEWTYHVLSMAREIAAASHGVFDPTVAPTLQRWGLLPSSSKPPQSSGDWRDLELLPNLQVRFARSLTLELGGIAKGFAVDCAVAALQTGGVESGLVNAGGDLRAFGPRTQSVQLRDPRLPGRLVKSFHLSNEALATSTRPQVPPMSPT